MNHKYSIKYYCCNNQLMCITIAALMFFPQFHNFPLCYLFVFVLSFRNSAKKHESTAEQDAYYCLLFWQNFLLLGNGKYWLILYERMPNVCVCTISMSSIWIKRKAKKKGQSKKKSKQSTHCVIVRDSFNFVSIVWIFSCFFISFYVWLLFFFCWMKL